MWTRKRTSKGPPPEPFSLEEQAIVQAAQASFQFFLQQVYPCSFEGRTWRMADKQMHPFSLGYTHYVWAKMVEEHPRVCILAPRAHLKSTVLNHAFAFWKLFSANQNVDGIVMSYKDQLAAEHTTKLKECIQNNRFCRMWVDRKPMAESVVDFDITFGLGHEWRGQVDPYGVMSTVRGLHPKFLICFTPDTRVRVSRSKYVAISDLVPGDFVVGHSGERREVLEVQRRPYDGELVVIECDDGTVVRATPNHPFLAKRGWTEAGDLAVGDVLETGEAEYGPRMRVFSCEECGARFLAYHGSARRFCGKGCGVASTNHLADRTGERNGRWTGGQVTVACAREKCSGTRVLTPAKVRYAEERSGRLYCSRECRDLEYGHQFSGERNPNWRGGSSTRRRAAGPEFIESLREQVRDLYGRRCAWCGSPEAEDRFGRRLDVHHIDRDRWNNAVDNLIALCRSCHAKTNISLEHDELIRGLVLTHNGRLVVSVTREAYVGDVYNLDVDVDHTYQLANDSIVHNCDDILSDFANALEPVQIRRIDNIFKQSLESLPDEADSLIVIGTPQSYEDTLYQLKANQAYAWGLFSAEQEGGRALWPEKFDQARLARVKSSVGDMAYEVEYLLRPVLAVNSFLPQAVVEDSCDPYMQSLPLEVSFNGAGTIGIYGGMDVGKHVHPTHISIGALMPTGDIVQIYQEFLDKMDYTSQAKHVRKLIEHFKVKRFYYDSTRGEMEDRHMSRRALGVVFTQARRVQMALGLEGRFYADQDEPGIVLIKDARQIRQMVSVDRQLKPISTADGHGDAFWSVALMVRAADDGPVIQMLGNAQEMFGGGMHHRRQLPQAMLLSGRTG